MIPQLKIAARLMVSFGLLNLMIAGLNGYTIVQGQGTQELVDATLRAAKNQSKTQTIVADLNKTRMNVWAFLALGDQAKWQDAEHSFEKMEKTLHDLTQSTLDPRRKETLIEADKVLDQYKAAILKIHEVGGHNDKLKTPEVVKLLGEIGEAATKMDSTGAELAEKYQQVAAERAEKAMERIKSLNDWSYIIGWGWPR